MKRARKIIIPVVLLVTIAMTVGWRLQATREDQPNGLTLFGNVEIRDAQLAFKEPERITRVLVDEGDRVTEGQVLATLDTDRLKAQIEEAKAAIEAQSEVVKRLENGTRKEEIEQAQAQVAASDARYRNEKQRLQRLQETTATGATSRQDYDDVRARVEVEQAQLQADRQALKLALAGPRQEDIQEAKAQLKARQDALGLLRIRLQDLTLRSPADGIIRSRMMEPGEMASPATPVLTLALTDPKWVRAYIPEPDLGRIAPGMRATVTSDAFSKKGFGGWIGSISPVAEFTPRSVETTDLRTKLVYEVRVHVDDPDDQLRLGIPVTVTIDRQSGEPQA
jgi:HlyD family secretion protein